MKPQPFPERRKVRRSRMPSMRKPRRVLLAVGLCGLIVGFYLVVKNIGGERKFLMIGLVYVLSSFFFIGLGQALAGMSRVRRNSVRRKSQSG